MSEKTVTVRVAVAVDNSGHWVATLPIPEVQEVEASVEGE